MEYILLVVGIITMTTPLLTVTRTLMSTVMIKAIPFLSGIFIVFYAMKDLGWVLNI